MTEVHVERPGTVPAEGEAARRLRFSTLARVFVRSLSIQASWNRRGMQNLGFAYAMWPAIEALYPDPARRLAAVRRHLSFFNTHPYLAAAILGGAIYHEERVARGEEPPLAVEQFKQALMGPLAAVGDSYFWLALRPFAGAASALLAPFIGLWALLVFLLAFNLPHAALRLRLFFQGYRDGDRVVESVARLGLPAKGAWLRAMTAVLGGVAVVYSGLFAARQPSPVLAGMVPAGLAAAMAIGVGSFLVLGKRGPVLAGCLAIGLGLILVLVGEGL